MEGIWGATEWRMGDASLKSTCNEEFNEILMGKKSLLACFKGREGASIRYSRESSPTNVWVGGTEFQKAKLFHYIL